VPAFDAQLSLRTAEATVEALVAGREGSRPDALTITISSVVAAILTFILAKMLDRLRRKDAESDAKGILDKAQLDASNYKREAELVMKESAIKQKAEGERELGQLRQELHERERLLDKRQDAIEQQSEQVRKQERMVESNQRKLAERIEDANRRNEELTKLLDLQRQTLHQLSGLSRDDATSRLLEMLDQELQNEQGALIVKHERRLAEIAETKTREVLLTSIHRYAAAHTAETTTSTVDIPSDEMKGRIIGREGRNIRAFEKATGVDVIIDDTPGVVIVSGFDPVRREIARMALNKLIADGRIHPSRIEEVVTKRRAGWSSISEIRRRGGAETDVPRLREDRPFARPRCFRTELRPNNAAALIEVAFPPA
jgi:ribonuclease Y